MTDPRPSTEAELVEHLRSIDIRAPDSLHQRVEALVADRSPRANRSPRGARRRGGDSAPRSFGRAPRLAAARAIAAAIAAVAIAVGLSGGGGSTPTLGQASALTLRQATAPAPQESAHNHAELAASVDGVSFPYWGGHLGWRTTGARTDHIAGRTITTIFYANRRGQRVGYAIVSGAAPKRAHGDAVARRDGNRYWMSSQNGVKVVTWLRGGHLCVVSGRGVSSATLLRLASWDDHDTVAS